MRLLTCMALLVGGLLAAPALAQTAAATFTNQKGETVGTAKLTGTAVGVLIEVEVRGLPANRWVAFHVHETGTCDHHGGHTSAGGHYNPTGRAHGVLIPGGPHAGDMPNQYVPADGVLRAQVLNTFVTLDRGAAGIAGRALMIHGGTDDHRTQPTGNAGDRQACAVIGG